MQLSFFATPAEFRVWLSQNHATVPELWVAIAKKGTGIASMTYAEALDEALCFGWIDGLKKNHDPSHFQQRFTPRKSRSLWSRTNVQHAERLVDEGRMMPSGHAQMEAAKRDGCWVAAYDGGARSTVPGDLQAALDVEPRVAAFFASLSGANRYAILFRLQTANKPELRNKRLAVILAMLREGRVFHPSRPVRAPSADPHAL